MRARIHSIDYHLPARILSNDELAFQFPERSADDITQKLGIFERRIADQGECASDLGVRAAQKLFDRNVCIPNQIDYLIFCSQCPDYILPATACLIARRLGLPHNCGAIDVNLGCSGYVYGLGLAKGLIESGQARYVLLIAADTYTHYLHPTDKSTRALFGDAGTATFIDGVASEQELIGPFYYGTDGEGANHLKIEVGGCRKRLSTEPLDTYLLMDGREVFNFAAQVIPTSLKDYLCRHNMTVEDVDHFVFHQANRFMLEHLRNKCGIPHDKFVVALDKTGNTVSATIPIALMQSAVTNRFKGGDRLLLLGFGVGFSWAIASARWPNLHEVD